VEGDGKESSSKMKRKEKRKNNPKIVHAPRTNFPNGVQAHSHHFRGGAIRHEMVRERLYARR
jgi:hypothetical protein